MKEICRVPQREADPKAASKRKSGKLDNTNLCDTIKMLFSGIQPLKSIPFSSVSHLRRQR
ncbi:MAG: hypothetical protein ABSG17_16950 [Spirochaetia bacterium]|jgi:hypothetical protein